MDRSVTANCQWFACETIVRPTDRGWFDQEGAPELGVALCDSHLDFVLTHATPLSGLVQFAPQSMERLADEWDRDHPDFYDDESTPKGGE